MNNQPTPNVDEMKNILNNETRHNWNKKEEKSTRISFYNQGGQYRFVAKYFEDEDYWRLQLIDMEWDTEEPRYALGPIQNGDKITTEMPTFLRNNL